VSDQVDGPELRAEQADLSRDRLDHLLIGTLLREHHVEMALVLNNLSAERLRLGKHGFAEVLGLHALVHRQSERVGKFQHVKRAGVAVEFGRLGHPHPSTFQQVGDVVGREGRRVLTLIVGVLVLLMFIVLRVSYNREQKADKGKFA